MRVINGKKFYKAQMDAAVQIDSGGWDTYNGRNSQWYTLFYNPECGYVTLCANNSGDCYGDYRTRYFDSPASFVDWCKENGRSLETLLGNIDEDNTAALDFVDAITKSNSLAKAEPNKPKASVDKFSIVWSAEDVIEAASLSNIDLDYEEAKRILEKVWKGFSETLTQTGNEILIEIVWAMFSPRNK